VLHQIDAAHTHAVHIRAVQVCDAPADYPITNKHHTDEELDCLPAAGFTAPSCTISAQQWLYGSGSGAAPIIHDDLASNVKGGQDM
jgi:hypothetical protein